jgi:hypothetical protein
LVEHYRVLDLQGRTVSAPAAERGGDDGGYEPTVASVWHRAAGLDVRTHRAAVDVAVPTL